MSDVYVHGYQPRENERLQDQAGTLVDLLHSVEFRHGDIFDSSFSTESFDHVFVCFVLEHLARPVEALALLHQQLRPAAPSPSSRAITARPTFIPIAPRLMRRSSARSPCRRRPAGTR